MSLFYVSYLLLLVNSAYGIMVSMNHNDKLNEANTVDNQQF